MIYYVEDDTNIRELTVYALKQAGFEACGFPAAKEFFAACDERLPELVLLDIMLPEVDGLSILRTLREGPRMRRTPVIMLTAKGAEYDTVLGLDAGADDYLAKPFGMMELVSRVNALLRRTAELGAEAFASDPDTLRYGAIELSIPEHTVHAGGTLVELTLKEFDLLHTLIKSPGRVFTRDQLLDSIWDMAYAGGTRTVDVHIQTLRQKLATACPGAESAINTVRGVGYCAKTDKTGTDKTGAEKAGAAEKAATGKVGTGKAATEKAGAAEKAATGKAGTGKAATDKAGTKNAGAAEKAPR